jgi:hypothetical protein
MPLSGQGMLITMMDVDAAEELDFNDWYDKEHLAERVGIEGFTEARRYIAVDARPKYLNLYTTRTFDILSSPQYQKALQNQTARSLHHIERFRNGGRAIVRITSSQGQGRGSALFFAAIRPTGADVAALRSRLMEALGKLVSQNEIISAHLVESDPQLSKPLTEDVPPPSASDWYLMIDGTSPAAVGRHGKALLGDATVMPASAVVSQGIYSLMWDLSKAEL